MRYLKDENRILLTVSELVITAYRGISPRLPEDGTLPRPDAVYEGERLDFSEGGYDFTLIYDDSENEFEIRGSKPTREERAIAEGIAFVKAFATTQSLGESEKITVSLRYVSKKDGEQTEAKKETTYKSLRSFFDKLTQVLPSYARAEIERVTVRMPSLAAMKFPYGSPRPSQSEFIKSTYRAISRGVDLLAEAPTGTGKTVSSIFPALRALGDGRIEKAFYFTPKATTARAASDCIRDIAKGGVRVRATVLYSKERICNRALICREAGGDCPGLSVNKITEATLALFDKCLPVTEREDILSVAEEYGICPHELALSYSELCDLIVLDVNYLFDPHVYIRRYFDTRGEFAFLIDEAHNLADRVRDTYSVSISAEDILAPVTSEQIGELSPLKSAARCAAEKFTELLIPYLKDELYTDKNEKQHGAYHSSRLPEGLLPIFERLSEITEGEVRSALFARDDEALARLKLARDYHRLVSSFCDALSRFDESYRLFAFYDDGRVSAKVFCIDTAQIIKERTELGRSTVFFSATLSPHEYYRSLLGLDRSSGAITLASPFSEEQMQVIVMNKVSTRTSERERTLGAVCRVIAATLSAKRGNYMIFAPSYAYAEALYKYFSNKYPKIRSILQTQSMTDEKRREFLEGFDDPTGNYLVAFCVLGSIYSEGIDLTGNKLIGAVVVGIGTPALSFEREAIAAYYDEKMDSGKQFAYVYPGLNKVLQAAGRVIRTEEDRGVIVLVDDRFDDPIYKKTAPKVWRGMKFLSDARELKEELEAFWLEADES